jgi:signal transduction histidine kinase
VSYKVESRLQTRFLMGQGLALAVYAFVPPDTLARFGWQVVMGWAAAAAIAIGARRHRPGGAATWYLFAAGLFLNTSGILVAGILTRLGGDGELESPSYADLFYLWIFPCLGGGLALMIRRRSEGRDLSTLIDTTIITTGLALLSWVFLIRPQAANLHLGPLSRAVVCAYPIGDIVVLATMVRLLLGGGDRNPALRLIIAALFCFLGTDVGWAVVSGMEIHVGRGLATLLEGGSLTAFTLIGAAALHPSMVELTCQTPGRRQGLSRLLLSGLTVASLIAPAVLAFEWVRGRIEDGAAIALCSAVLFLLVVARMAQLLLQVERQTAELSARNRAARLVLDTINEGLVTLTPDGHLAEERSAMVDRWFGLFPGPVSFVEYIRHVDPRFADWFRLGHEALREGVLPEEVLLGQLPSRLQVGRRQFQVAYLPLGDGGLLLVIDDVSATAELAQHEAEQREMLTLFQRLTVDRVGLFAFLEEAGRLLDQIAASTEIIEQQRLLHTLKGNTAMLGLGVIAALCHRAEDELEGQGRATITPAVIALRARWNTLVETFTTLGGDGNRGEIHVASDDLEQLSRDVVRGLPPGEVVRRLASWRCEPASAPLQRLADHARGLALRLGKGDPVVDVAGDGLWLDRQRWGSLWAELVHMVNNAVDHGFESPEERRLASKPPRPRLRLGARSEGDQLVIEVADDGRGIDWERVRSKALEKGLPSQTLADWTAALFSPGFSTQSEVTDTSGRGIGLSSVRARVTQHGGTLAVDSQPGAGTTWRLEFPLSELATHETVEARRPGQATG